MKTTVPLMLSLLAACGGDKDSGDTTTPVDTGGPSEELPEVWINEFMASNTLTIMDEAGAYPDWVELYNASDAEADISGWWLTDDLSDIFKHRFDEGTVIPAGGYLVVFCDGDVDEGPLHAEFQLAAEGGEDLGLFGPNVLDNPEVDSLSSFGPQTSDISLARTPDGSPNFAEASPATPGASNGG